jgi:hypothetical protein
MKTAILVALIATSCGGTSNRCSTEPIGSINAFPSRDATLVVDRVTPISSGYRYDFRDGTPLTWIGQEALPIATGHSYRFVVDYRPGAPDATSILIFDGETLLFAAVTDQRIRRDIPGFELSVGAAACGSRGSTRCHDALVNLPLLITHAGESQTIHHGQTAQLGDYEVRALTVQRVAYNSRCADAGLSAISIIIRKTGRRAD